MTRRTLHRVLAGAVPVLAVLSLAGAAGAAAPAAPSPSPSPASSDQLVQDARAQLSANLATALAAQEQLGRALSENAQQQQQLTAQLDATQAQVADLDTAIARRDQQIQDTQVRIAAERAQMATLARVVYAQPSNLLERIAERGNLKDVLIGTADLAAAAQRAHELQTELTRDLSDLQAAQDLQRADRQRLATLAARQAQSLQSLRELQAQEEQTSTALASAIAHTEAELAAVNGQNPDLALRILRELQSGQGQIVGAAEQEAWSQAALWLQVNPVGSSPLSAGHSVSTRFTWPLPQATITQGFGPTDLAFEPSFAGYPHFHTGVDMAEPAGSPVLAADDGVVAVSNSGNTGYGNYVVIAHASGMATLYGHLAQSLVHVGQRVTQGQPIGLEGSTGNSTGPHLHFEARVNGQPVDPTPFLPSGGPTASRA